MAPLFASNSCPNSRSSTKQSGSDGEKANSQPVQEYLTNCRSLYICIYCRTHLANHDDLVSKAFIGEHGRAYLFSSVINVSQGPLVQRQLITGTHAVTDIFCSNCRTKLGWKYVMAFVETQKFKENKYIIESAHIVRENRYLELDRGEKLFEKVSTRLSTRCSKTPPSLGDWPAGIIDDGLDNEDLIFPFYDDICASYSSFNFNLSSITHMRSRRSLYLDSVPYDWKHSSGGRQEFTSSVDVSNIPSSSSSSGEPQQSGSVTSSGFGSSATDSSSPSSPCTSSSSGGSVALDKIRETRRARRYRLSEGLDSDQGTNDEDDDEIQFRFDDEKSDPNERSRDYSGACTTNNSTKNPTRESERLIDASTNKGALLVHSDSSLSLDDDVFFDCLSEHAPVATKDSNC